MAVCNKEDDFILEKVRWVVTLSNGERIYQDDNRPGEVEPKAWMRLRAYLKENNLSIVKFELQFCDHIEEAAPPNCDGYYFVQRVEAMAFTESNSTIRSYVIGFLKDGVLKVIYWRVPEIIPTGSELRPIDLDSPNLIVNPTG